MNKLFAKIFILLAIFGTIGAPFVAEAARTQTFAGIGYFTALGDAQSTIYYNSGWVDIGSMLSSIATLYVQGTAGSATSTFAVASSTTQKIFDVSSTGTTTIRQYQGFGTPTVATSTGAGSLVGTSTLSTGSSDLAGSVTIVTGATPAAKATIFTFTSASSTNPFCVYSPANARAIDVATSTFITNTATGFSLVASTTQLIGLSTYQWNYLCN